MLRTIDSRWCAAPLAAIAGLLVTAALAPAAAAFTAVNGKIAFVSARDGNNEIYSMNADGTGQLNLTANGAGDTQPAWSPDSTKIAFTSGRDGNNEIYSMNADGTGQLNLTGNAATDSDPKWSPDGSKIAFSSNRTGANWDIYVMNADGSGITRVTTDPSLDAQPAWSPDGTRIAFRRTLAGGNLEIFRMNADGTGELQLTFNAVAPNDRDQSPAWSPDGSKIWFDTNRDAGDYEVYAMNPDGTAPTRITTIAGVDARPSWAPDGTRIVFESGRSGDSEIWTMAPDGSGAVNLSNIAGADYDPDWQLAPPTCAGVSQPIPFGTATQVALGCSDPGGNPLTYEFLASPAHGTLGEQGSGQVTYSPSLDYTGGDEFAFRATNGRARSQVATASLAVQGDVTEPKATLTGRTCRRRSPGAGRRRVCRLSGRASDPAPGTGIARVEVNVRRRIGKRGRCIALGSHGRSKRTSCRKARKVWVRAKLKGADPVKWRLRVRVPPGRYAVRARATDGAGNTQAKPARKTLRPS